MLGTRGRAGAVGLDAGASGAPFEGRVPSVMEADVAEERMTGRMGNGGGIGRTAGSAFGAGVSVAGWAGGSVAVVEEELTEWTSALRREIWTSRLFWRRSRSFSRASATRHFTTSQATRQRRRRKMRIPLTGNLDSWMGSLPCACAVARSVAGPVQYS